MLRHLVDLEGQNIGYMILWVVVKRTICLGIEFRYYDYDEEGFANSVIRWGSTSCLFTGLVT